MNSIQSILIAYKMKTRKATSKAVYPIFILVFSLSLAIAVNLCFMPSTSVNGLAPSPTWDDVPWDDFIPNTVELSIGDRYVGTVRVCYIYGGIVEGSGLMNIVEGSGSRTSASYQIWFEEGNVFHFRYTTYLNVDFSPSFYATAKYNVTDMNSQRVILELLEIQNE